MTLYSHNSNNVMVGTAN